MFISSYKNIRNYYYYFKFSLYKYCFLKRLDFIFTLLKSRGGHVACWIIKFEIVVWVIIIGYTCLVLYYCLFWDSLCGNRFQPGRELVRLLLWLRQVLHLPRGRVQRRLDGGHRLCKFQTPSQQSSLWRWHSSSEEKWVGKQRLNHQVRTLLYCLRGSKK